MIYLDNAATTMHKPQEVIEAVVAAMSSMGNAGRGVNDASLSASRLIYNTREKLCKLVGGTDPRQVVFTCNSTESLNIALRGLLEPGDHVITTMLEHNSVLRPPPRPPGWGRPAARGGRRRRRRRGSPGPPGPPPGVPAGDRKSTRLNSSHWS